MASRFFAIGTLAAITALAAASDVSTSRHTHLRPSVAPGTARLHVFGARSAQQSRSAAGAKFDGALADLTRHASLARPDHAVEDLRSLAPGARFTQSAGNAGPLVLIDSVTLGDPQQLKTALVALGLQRASVYSNDVGGWLPVSRLDAATARAEVHSIRAAMSRTVPAAAAMCAWERFSTPESPRSISLFDCSGPQSRGVHQVWFVDGETVHFSGGAADFHPRNPKDDQIYRAIDVRNPSQPQEICRWWMPGTREGDNEPPPPRHPKFDGGFRTHNTNVYPERPDRAYLAYIDGGIFIVDISDKARPKAVGHWNPHPPFPGFSHTAMPLFEQPRRQHACHGIAEHGRLHAVAQIMFPGNREAQFDDPPIDRRVAEIDAESSVHRDARMTGIHMTMSYRSFADGWYTGLTHIHVPTALVRDRLEIHGPGEFGR